MKKKIIFCRNRGISCPLILLSMWMFFFCFSVPLSALEVPSLKIRGKHYGVFPFEKGQQPFFNRTNMSFSEIPEEYEGWEFVKVNAYNESYLPGPAPEFQVQADVSGYLIAMIATAQFPDVCSQWAKENGWELIPGPQLSYTSGEMGVLTFYRKKIEAGEWIEIVQPLTFSRAMIVAPKITDPEKVSIVPVQLTALGWMEVGTLAYGSPAFANRSYVFNNIPQSLNGMQFTRYRGGDVPDLRVTAGETGTMYIAAAPKVENGYFPEDHDWKKAEGLDFNYNDGTNTQFTVYKKEVKAGDTLTIRTNSWTGIWVLSPKIEFKTIYNFTPPPGVVIYNSKSQTKKHAGSPSITILEDGTYLASNDVFGASLPYTLIWKSTDKGKTWEKISEINPLNWAKLFTRGKELFIIGISAKCAMGYGDIVVFRSNDGGYTWTTPKDSKSGRLKSGYYHTAPTSVVFHNGKIWKAMENQGEAYWGWGPFTAFMMSIDEKADLLDVANWTFSNEIDHAAGQVPSKAWLEGNPVVARDGSIKDILRLDYPQDDRAAIVSISNDGKTATYNSQTDISYLPGGCKKFSIHFDSISNLYWTLSNYVLDPHRTGNLGSIRNSVVLTYSEDLINWTIKDTLLYYPEVGYHAFQYLDWAFEGDDIIAVSRTAWEDETGQAENYHNANYMTFHRFPNFRFERATADQSVVATSWYKNAESAFALTFDDGFEAHYQHAYPVLEKYGIQGTFFVNSGNLVKKGETPKERYGYEEDFKEMSDKGHEIASHSLTHPNLTSLDYDVLLEELQKDKENIESFTGKPCLTHAYPYCRRNDVVDQAMASYFLAGRQCGSLENTIPKTESGWFAIHSDLLTWTYPRSLENEKKSAEVSKEKIDKLHGKFGVVCIHETLPFDLLNTSDTYEVATTEWLEEMCKYLSAQQDAGKVWPTTFSNIVRYARARQNLRVSRQELAAGCIQYDFSTWLDPTIYDLPLTLECTLPKGWKEVKCQIKEGDKVISEELFTATDGKIMLDVIPDRQTLIMTDMTPNEVSSIQNEAKYHVYPNPVRNVLNIENLDQDTRCEFFDAQGRLVMSKDLGISPKAEIHVGNLPMGLYLVRFLTPDYTFLHSFTMIKN